MKLSQVGVQLYTVRDHLRDASAFARSLERLAHIGYQVVELVPSETISDSAIAKLCGEAGMTVAAAHLPGKLILEQPRAAVEKLQNLGTKLGVYPFPGDLELNSRPTWMRVIDQFKSAVETFRTAGLTLAYHNHAVEFLRLDGQQIFEVLRQGVPSLSFELDPYWAQYAGMNPERLTESLGERLVSLHLKDFGVAPRHGEPPVMMEVGEGNLDFKGLITAAQRAGCEWYIVEQDVTPGDPFESLERSFRYVHSELLG